MLAEDLAAILTLVVLECLLSADNVLVLAVMVQDLKPPWQSRALLYGMGGAFAFRAGALLGANWLMTTWWLQAIGAVYLGYLTFAYFARGKSEPHQPRNPAAVVGFWRTIATVELVDAAFAVDSVVVAIGLSRKLWVVYTGAALGIVGMRIATTLAVGLLRRFPELEGAAYVMVGWIGVKLLFSSWELFARHVLTRSDIGGGLPGWLFWTGMATIGLGATAFICWRHGTRSGHTGRKDRAE
jgi:YkoY family integral membrane protein